MRASPKARRAFRPSSGALEALTRSDGWVGECRLPTPCPLATVATKPGCIGTPGHVFPGQLACVVARCRTVQEQLNLVTWIARRVLLPTLVASLLATFLELQVSNRSHLKVETQVPVGGDVHMFSLLSTWLRSPWSLAKAERGLGDWFFLADTPVLQGTSCCTIAQHAVRELECMHTDPKPVASVRRRTQGLLPSPRSSLCLRSWYNMATLAWNPKWGRPGVVPFLSAPTHP